MTDIKTFVSANKHLTAVQLQQILMQHSVIVPIDKIKNELALVRAESHRTDEYVTSPKGKNIYIKDLDELTAYAVRAGFDIRKIF